jgi:hypothetical protein
MSRGLLLGNGINACLGINDLSMESIQERFWDYISVYSIILDKLFGVKINKDFERSINNESCRLGIETLAGRLYEYIKENKNTVWTDNDEYRIQDIITCICISDIFFTNEGKINQSYNTDRVPTMAGYDYIYTLNYIEFWDKDNKCIYLHGKVDLNKLNNEKNAILISKDRMSLNEYAETIRYIRKTQNVIEFEPINVVFAPETIEKERLICVKGLYPFNNLYPANDLFLYRSKELYRELDKVDELDVFGMSPYGDDSIIEKINSKNIVRIYVYNKENNNETYEWKNKLNCNYELRDSLEF